jgi:hypothetical protein
MLRPFEDSNLTLPADGKIKPERQFQFIIQAYTPPCMEWDKGPEQLLYQ